MFLPLFPEWRWSPDRINWL